MPTEIHIYTLNRGALDSFAAEWGDKIKPVRIKFGFRVQGGWKVDATSQFVWLLSYDGPDDWNARNRAFHDATERRALDPDPARHIARVELSWFSVNWSPSHARNEPAVVRSRACSRWAARRARATSSLRSRSTQIWMCRSASRSCGVT